MGTGVRRPRSFDAVSVLFWHLRKPLDVVARTHVDSARAWQATRSLKCPSNCLPAPRRSLASPVTQSTHTSETHRLGHVGGRVGEDRLAAVVAIRALPHDTHARHATRQLRQPQRMSLPPTRSTRQRPACVPVQRSGAPEFQERRNGTRPAQRAPGVRALGAAALTHACTMVIFLMLVLFFSCVSMVRSG